MNKWEPVIGLEVHVQLLTRSKLFSGASTQYGAAPNTQACAVDLGFPGVLPVLNQAAVRMAVKLGVAIGAEINKRSIFARKNYFYPDLPKGYQISQYEHPIVKGGFLEIMFEGESKRIGITRAHLEEDAGKSVHEDFHGSSGIDLNRAGTPLLEIVSEPDLRSAKEAVAYLKALHTLVRYLAICDGNMQEGSFRCDANVSIRREGDKKLGTRTEIKNVNSFRFVEKAIDYEIKRQSEVLESGGVVVQETRLYDSDQNETRPMRGKEEAHDYRYFPDPDLLPLELDEVFIQSVKTSLPELPGDRRKRFMSDYQLKFYDAEFLTESRELADFYEKAVLTAKGEAKLTANWIMGDLSAALNKSNVDITKSLVSPEALGDLVARIVDGTISGKIAKTVFEALWSGEGSVDEIIQKRNLKQVTEPSAIEAILDKVIQDNPKLWQSLKGGEEKLFGFFVGQVMKASRGRADPEQVNKLLKKRL
ncbi:MAG: Asp-tRNA(Asn)/Glu-tRNA(Gln) amidotransferase subunit GatB [Gammaproteobacteria bacterium]|nr:Asp-tRNA(Asn)/Glu-tRNA(Gln) amidotransferase subunit GatB [Gammaproteobacteria bacterium]